MVTASAGRYFHTFCGTISSNQDINQAHSEIHASNFYVK